jgi:hypothetical protein
MAARYCPRFIAGPSEVFGTLGRHQGAMRNPETIKSIRDQLKAIKEAITVIEFKLSQLESES